jgi:hypothetical protein
MHFKKYFLSLAGIILLSNLIWEFSHYKLYIDLTGIPKILHLIMASFSDLILILIIFMILSFLNKNLKWICAPRKFDYILVIIFSLAFAIILELINVYYLKRWSYTENMPAIFGIGLSPLFQLAVTGIFSLWLNNKAYNK